MDENSVIIHLKDICFTYPGGGPVADHLDFTLRKGEWVGLTGPNGSGKTTFLHIIMGLLRPSAGTVHILGKPMESEKDLRLVRRRVGLLFQDPDDQLFSPTVFDDVAFGPLYMGLDEDEVEQRVANSLGAVGMQGAGRRVPHHLSGGEKKRVAIATVLAMDPEILVLDEPTAGLDPRTRRGLINLLRELPQTMLVSTHDMGLVAESFERTVVIDEGRVVADGPTDEIMADSALLEAHGLEAP